MSSVLPSAPAGGWVPLRRKGLALRRALAAVLAAVAVLAGLAALRPRSTTGQLVVVAARDVPAGAALQQADLTVARRPGADLPAGAVTDATTLVGRVVAAPLAAREVLTGARLVGPELLAAAPDGDVALPVRFTDAGATGLLRPGQRVDVLAAFDESRTARTVARGATVLAVPAGQPQSGGLVGLGAGRAGRGFGGDGGTGGLVVLAVQDSTAAALTQAAASGSLSYLLR